jgi:hypothetical protein
LYHHQTTETFTFHILRMANFFAQAKDAKPIIYNYDGVKGKDKIVICEGEIDSLSWEVAGVKWHTSVNMGAPNVGDKSIDKKLECLTTCYDVFDEASAIYTLQQIMTIMVAICNRNLLDVLVQRNAE